MLKLFKNKSPKNLAKPTGAILFTVLVTMTLLIMLAGTLFATVYSERTEIIETAKTEQLYQTAVSVNDWVFDYLDALSSTLPTDLTLEEFMELDGLMPALLDLDVGDIIRTPVTPVSSAGSVLGSYEIIVERLADEDGYRIFEITTRVTNNADVVEFSRLVAYKDGSHQGDGPDGRRGFRSDDDGFFELPASYRGSPGIAVGDANFMGMNIVGRSYFGGHLDANGRPSNLVELNNLRIYQNMNVVDNAEMTGGTVFAGGMGFMRHNFYGDLEVAGGVTRSTTDGALFHGDGLIRVGGNMTSDPGIRANCTYYIFGDLTINQERIGENANVFVAGDLTLGSVNVASSSNLYVNGTYTKNGTVQTTGYQKWLPEMGDLTGDGMDDGLIEQFYELQDNVGYYKDEGLRDGERVWNIPGETAGLPVTLFNMSSNLSEVRKFEYDDENPGTIDVYTYITNDGKIGQHVESRGGNTQFQAFWAPKWRAQTNPSTDMLGRREDDENFYQRYEILPTDTRYKMQHNEIVLSTSAPATNLYQKSHATLDNTIIVTDSGYIAAPSATGDWANDGFVYPADAVSTIIVDTANGELDPAKHKDIYIALRTTSFTEFSLDATYPYFNILVKGAGNVVFIAENAMNTISADGSTHFDPATGEVVQSGDSTAGFNQTPNMFVGHMGWVDEFNSRTSSSLAYNGRLAEAFKGSDAFMGAITPADSQQGMLERGFLRSYIHPMDDCYDPDEINPASTSFVSEEKERVDSILAALPAGTTLGNINDKKNVLLPHKATCEYCKNENKGEGTFDYPERFGRHALRQDGSVNLVEKYGASYAGEGKYIHNNIFFVNDHDGTTPNASFYERDNVIFGYIYAPGSRSNFPTTGVDQKYYAIGVGGYIYGDFGTTNGHLGSRLQIIHMMPLDYYRGDDGRTNRGVVEAMVGGVFRGMQLRPGDSILPGPRPDPVPTPGRFTTVGFR